MAVSYKKLFHLLIEKNITNAQLQQEAGFPANIITRLKRGGYISLESVESNFQEQADLQELLSDISHQVKTPIANLRMVNFILMEQPLAEEKCQDYWFKNGRPCSKLRGIRSREIETRSSLSI